MAVVRDSAPAHGQSAAERKCSGGIRRAVLAACLSGLAVPASAQELRLGAHDFDDAREVEGNAGYVGTARVDGHDVALLSEQDWIGVETRLEIGDGGAPVDAVIVAQTAMASPLAFSPDGHPEGVAIPVAQIDLADGNRLRDALCPVVEQGRCSGGRALRARLVDDRGSWGGVLLLDLTDPAAPRLLDRWHCPGAARFPPPDVGVHAPNRAVLHGTLAFVAWNSHGLRVLDIGKAASAK